MPRVVLLGTGSALSGPDRENTFMLFEGNDTRILVDCAGSPAQRLAQVGVPVESVDILILTHSHPDHIYGLPVMALNAWIAGRRRPLDVYGLPETLRAARMILRAVGADHWPDFFPIRYHRVQPDGISLILSSREFTISATLTEHFVPTIALRVVWQATGSAVAYSCDTSPMENLVELARGASIFIHEATTLDTIGSGHSSAIQAGAEARRAGAKRLVLVHLPPDVKPARWRAAAKQEFNGSVIVARDLQSFTF
ncbi:MAG: ribonuclease Z [Anaerolineae bacterium]